MDGDAELLTAAVGEAARLLESDGGMIYLVTESGDELRFAYEAGIGDAAARRLLQDLRLPMGRGIFGTALARRELVWTGDYDADQSFGHHRVADEVVGRVGMRSMVAAPMFVNDAPFGVIGAYSSRTGAFSEWQLTLLRALADHAAAAIANVRLLAELQESAATNARLNEELRERTAAQARVVEAQFALSGIAVEIATIRDPQSALQRTVEEAYRVLGADVALINPLGEDGLLHRASVIYPVDEPFPELTYDPGVGMSGRAMDERRAVRTDDYMNEAGISHVGTLDDYVTERGIRSVIAAPMIGGDDLIGTLSVLAKQPAAFDDDDAQLLGAFAAQAATAVVNARLYARLERSEARYRHLVEQSPDLVWEADADGKLTYLGETLQRLTGFTPQELDGRHWTSLLTPDSHEVAENAWQETRERPDEEVQFRVRAVRSDGSAMAAEINMVGTVVEGRFDGAHGSLRDVTEREQLEGDLRQRSVELAANEERAKLARELHDSVTQALFSMGLTLRTYEILSQRDPAAAAAKLEELRQLQADALAEMRTLIFELRPHGLEADGLEQALRNHAAAVAGRTGLAIAVDGRLDDRLDPAVEEALYRIGQEALHNVVKHANATSAQVHVEATARQVRLTVEDDGAGFDPALVASGKLGLVGMRQRAEQLGGRLSIRRRPGGGTRVAAAVPLRPQ